MKKLKYTLIVIVVLALITGIGICLYFSFTKDLSPNEPLMMAILVTFFSMFISWILTHVYSQLSLNVHTEIVRKQHEENIRTYAIKAAEKLRDVGYVVENVVAIINRQEGTEADDAMDDADLNLISLFKLEELI